MKARKKPIVIEYKELRSDNILEVVKFLEGEKLDVKNSVISDMFEQYFEEYEAIAQEKGLRIVTLEGTMTADIGDFIIQGVDGEFYPCKPDIFHKTYDILLEEEDK